MSKKVLPRVVFDYIEGGADDEITMKANVDDFNKICLLQKVDGTISKPELSTDVLGKKLSFPLILAPCGLVRVSGRCVDKPTIISVKNIPIERT